MKSYLGGCKAGWAALLPHKGFCHWGRAVAASGASPPVAPGEPGPMASAEAISWLSLGSDFISVGSLATWHLLAASVFTYS